MFRASFLVALLALVSSMTLPFGYMPAKAGDGSFILRICDGTLQAEQEIPDHAVHDKAQHAQMDHDRFGSVHTEHEGSGAETRCTYAVVVAANLPDAPCIKHCQLSIENAQPEFLAVLTAIYPPNLPPSTGPPAV